MKKTLLIALIVPTVIIAISASVYGAREIRYGSYGNSDFGYDDMYYDRPQYERSYMDYPAYEYDDSYTLPIDNYRYVDGVYWFNDDGTWYYHRDGKWNVDTEGRYKDFER